MLRRGDGEVKDAARSLQPRRGSTNSRRVPADFRSGPRSVLWGLARGPRDGTETSSVSLGEPLPFFERPSVFFGRGSSLFGGGGAFFGGPSPLFGEGPSFFGGSSSFLGGAPSLFLEGGSF